MDESIDNLLDVSVDCDIDDELRNKEWYGNVEVEVESGSHGQSTVSEPQMNQSYDTGVEDDVLFMILSGAATCHTRTSACS